MVKIFRINLFICLFSLLVFPLAGQSAETLYEASFKEAGWDADDWLLVKSPRWDYIGSWIQMEDHIRNLTPEGHDRDRLIGRPHAYASMVLREPFDTRRGLEIECLMEFDFDQGPQIVLAWGVGEDENGYPEYREHVEVVLWSQGINIWHHTYEDEPSWVRSAYARFPLERRVPYRVRVRVEKPLLRSGAPELEGRVIAVSVDGKHLFAYHEPSIPEEIHVGVIGYASINRFYDFKVSRP